MGVYETKRILDVGQCPRDRGLIERFLLSFNERLQISHVDCITEALKSLKENKFDLVLVNRKIDCDYSDGIELVRLIQEFPEQQRPPVMLVSNYPDAQAVAVNHGAVPGFGKNFDISSQTRDFLSRHLN